MTETFGEGNKSEEDSMVPLQWTVQSTDHMAADDTVISSSTNSQEVMQLRNNKQESALSLLMNSSDCTVHLLFSTQSKYNSQMPYNSCQWKVIYLNMKENGCNFFFFFLEMKIVSLLLRQQKQWVKLTDLKHQVVCAFRFFFFFFFSLCYSSSSSIKTVLIRCFKVSSLCLGSEPACWGHAELL